MNTFRNVTTIAMLAIASFCAHAQSPGLIVRPAGGSGVTSLNPNGDGYSSATTAGFTSNDITESEIPFKVIPTAVTELSGDLNTGPSGGYTDIVVAYGGSGMYLYKDATNIYYRLRIGGIVSGAKAYSVLIDADLKMGNTGPAADPNYLPPSSGNNGNPGFEYEVVFRSNSGIFVYSVDGSTSLSLVSSYSLTTNSQVSVALSTDSNNPDYFYDWFVPLSSIGNPGSIRLVGATLNSPNSAFEDNRSDVYGLNDLNYTSTIKAWETAVNAQPAINLTTFTGVSATCTAAPVLNSPISTGSSVTVSGTWTRLDATKPSSATISLYKNNTLVSTTTVSSGATWNIVVPSVATGDVFYAKALASGESECLASNNVQAVGCTNQTSLTGVSVTCGTLRGFNGTAASATSVVRIYTVTTSGYTLFADETTTTYKVIRSGTAWKYDGPNVNSADPCTGGATDVPAGSYAITVQSPGQCESDYLSYCDNLTQTAAPTITQTTLSNASTTVSGTTVASATVRLIINGQLYGAVTASGTGAYSYTGLVLRAGDVVEVSAQASGQCVSNRTSRTVVCLTSAPTITTDKNGNLIVGATTITGRSTEPTATTIRVYDNLNALVGTTAVLSDGTWSLTATVAAGKSYYATAQYSTCTVSSNSTSAAAFAITTVCPTITSSPTESSTTVSGTLPSAFTGTVKLYLDDYLVGSQSVTSATTWSITPSVSLYSNGVLKATALAASSAESTGCSTATISCTSPSTPSITPTSSSIYTGQTVTLNVTNVDANTWYALLDNSGVSYATSSYRTASTSFNIMTNTFNSAGTYNLKVTADKLTGCPASFSSTSITVIAALLPVEFVKIEAEKAREGVSVRWEVANEINVDYYEVQKSVDGTHFSTIGGVEATASKHYALLDDAVDASVPTHYYRIKQMDHDGKFEFSKVVSVANKQYATLKLVPNPAAYEVQVGITSAVDDERANLELIDSKGRVVVTQLLTIQKGENTILLNDLAAMPRGQYAIRLRTSAGTTFAKLVLQ
ncbi:MAG: T9SS type A sorting domain-containing protein [Saprospiraceae bacterium]|nr:T9SS type A sorting domain-containing protein [Saprospiraceae bacterium]